MPVAQTRRSPFVPPNPITKPVTLAPGLPVSEHGEELVKAIRENPVIVVCGETGSGKTTQLPKICLLAGRGTKGLIGHTQPRRIAASSIAKRIAAELESEVGEIVGYKVRFTDKTMPGAAIKLMTDGILLAETQTDPLLKRYDTIIIDEAHERSINIDFLLGYLKRVLAKRRISRSSSPRQQLMRNALPSTLKSTANRHRCLRSRGAPIPCRFAGVRWTIPMRPTTRR